MGTQAGWSGVRERVIAVVEAERRGWKSRYPVFEPVLTAAEVAEVEAQYGVELPEEYRTFVMEVGAGGPGPTLGHLTSLRRVDGKWGWVWEDASMPVDLSGPFLEAEEWADQQVATLRAAGYEPTTPDEGQGYLDDYLEAFGEAGDEIWHMERDRGAILISDNGCAMTGWLIVVGPHRGEVRDRPDGFDSPFNPYLDAHGNRHSFRTWYLEWLEERERELL